MERRNVICLRRWDYRLLYVKEGNKVADLIEAFKRVKDTKKAVVVHINTQKGKGYKLAEGT